MEELLNNFYSEYKKEVLSLSNWIKIKNKNFTLKSALVFILKYYGNDFYKSAKFIERLTTYSKKYGRGHSYNDYDSPSVDLIKNDNGFIVIDNGNKEQYSGYKLKRDEGPFTKSGAINKNYDKMNNLLNYCGKFLRYKFPNDSNNDIYEKLIEIRKFASANKVSYAKVCDLIDKEKIIFRNTSKGFYLVRNNKSMDEEYEKNDSQDVTFFSFMVNVKKFLRDLLLNPMDAKTPYIFKENKIYKNELIKLLIRFNIIEKDEKIIDKDSNGEFVKPKLNIRFRVPYRDLDRKIKKLYIKIFEKNVREIHEDGEGATNSSSSGQFSQPLFSVQRRDFYKLK